MSKSEVWKVDESTGRHYKEVTIRVDHATTDSGQVTLYNDDPKYWCTVMGMFTESIHQGYDGFEPHEQVIIAKYLEDIVTACNEELGLTDVDNRVGTEGGQE